MAFLIQSRKFNGENIFIFKAINLKSDSLFSLPNTYQLKKLMVFIFRSRFELGIGGYEYTSGLWQSCETSPDTKSCVSVKCPSEVSGSTSVCSKILAARAFMTLACIISGIAAICSFACAVTKDSTNRILLLGTKGLVFLCLVMGIIGVAVGINATLNSGLDEIGFKLGAAAIVGIVAIIINFGGAIAALFIK